MTIQPAPAPTVDFAGKWVNDLNSEMELTVVGNELRGTYRTNVGQPAPTEEFALIGLVTEDIISFSVNFGIYGSLTAWVGQHIEGPSGNFKIKTLWHLTKNVQDSDEPEDLWSSILAGANTFSRN